MKKFWQRIREKLRPKSHTVSSLFFLFLASIFIFVLLEIFNNNFEQPTLIVYFPTHWRMFVFNVLIIFCTLSLLWAILDNPILVATTASALVFVVGYINTQKIYSRNTPFLPEDFGLAGEVGSMTDFITIGSVLKFALPLILTVIIGIVFARSKLAKKLLLTPQKKTDSIKKYRTILNHCLIGFCSLLTLVIGVVIIDAYAASGISYSEMFNTFFTVWNQNKNYRDNGFVVGFIYNIRAFEIPAPDDYNEVTIADLKQKYNEIAEKKNKKRQEPEDVNVIIILNETFIDPDLEYNGETLRKYYNFGNKDVTPNLHKIQKAHASGYMYSPVFGGGTANIEFEALTGLSNYWFNTTPYTTIIPKLDYMPSVARMFKDDTDYGTTAIHPYSGGMYKRNFALEKEGFEKFITERDISYTEKDPGSEYINDRSAYNETLRVLQENEESQLISLITMQNHTPYEDLNYPGDDFAPLAINGNFEEYSESELKDIQKYLQSLHSSDAYLGEFISELDKMDKKTVVLFFGDHYPGALRQYEMSENDDVIMLSHLTPYFIYTNFDYEGKKKDLPTTTPNCLVNTMMNRLNWQKDSYYYLLDTVCREEPIFSKEYDDIPEEEIKAEKPILSDYKMLVYDILLGKQYWLK